MLLGSICRFNCLVSLLDDYSLDAVILKNTMILPVITIMN